MKSLIEATHLLNHNADVLRKTHEKQKSSMKQKNKSFFNFNFQCEYKSWKCDLSIF